MSNVTPGSSTGAPPRATTGPPTTGPDKEPVVIPAGATSEREPSAWTIWVGFAGVMMLIGGALNVAWGIVALANEN